MDLGRPEMRDSASAAKPRMLFQSNILALLTSIWFLLIAASAVQDALNGSGLVESKIWILDVELEVGIYTWFSTVNLALAGIILGAISLYKFESKDRLRFHWLLLSVIFIALSVDEHSSIHEALSGRLSGMIQTSGVFNFVWVIPAIVACAVGLILFIPFIAEFPPQLRVYLILSAVAFLTGAIGMEMLGGAVAEQGGDVRKSFAYRTLATIEEALEGIGVIIFIGVLLAYGAARDILRSPISPAAK